MTQTQGTVLVVDDVADARDLASTVLSLGGYSVIEAASGAEALRRVEDGPDLVVLDVHLPDMDGFEVCRRIKENPTSATMPVVQVSAVFSRTEHRVRGLTGGADAYLTKPFEPDLLVATVNALMRLRTAERELFRSNRVLRLQAELTRVLVDAAAPDVIPRLLETIGAPLGGDAGELWHLDSVTDTLVRDGSWYAGGAGGGVALERASAGVQLPRNAGLAGRAWAGATVEWINDLERRLAPARAEAAME